jgi:hypothetical protein
MCEAATNSRQQMQIEGHSPNIMWNKYKSCISLISKVQLAPYIPSFDEQMLIADFDSSKK